ncbi:hypothetical protein BDN72DRAFT_904723 [Pluteus cervinus]|uniref:Uncharacterized protein n=1 Tax=Pluteus cervinus TaxID=181527 RepID=A0ACD3A4V0_9AGAR|nr:hypothetical protein BDN72DRAFT_904723 [Pluteus cervinus]
MPPASRCKIPGTGTFRLSLPPASVEPVQGVPFDSGHGESLCTDTGVSKALHPAGSTANNPDCGSSPSITPLDSGRGPGESSSTDTGVNQTLLPAGSMASNADIGSSPSIVTSVIQEEELEGPILPSSLTVPIPRDPEWFSNELLTALGLLIHLRLRVFVCVNCRQAWVPDRLVRHVKTHKLAVSPKEESQLKGLVDTYHIHEDKDFDYPPRTDPPIDILVVHKEGYRCAVCPRAFLTFNTFRKHWSDEHAADHAQTPVDQRAKIGAVQGLFGNTGFFGVNVQTTRTSTPAFRLYLEEKASQLPPAPTIPAAQQEWPPLVVATGWPHVLEPYFGTIGSKRRGALRSLIHPKPDEWAPIKDAVVLYMTHISKLAEKTLLGIRYLLEDCPRQEDTKPWKYLVNESTIDNYSRTAASLLFSIATTLDSNHPSEYKFPLSSKSKAAFRRLKSTWKSTKEIPMDVIHRALASLLLVEYRDKPTFDDKWEDPVEHWLAAYALSASGNFIKASEFTQVLARLEYHCRSVVLYEAVQRRNETKEPKEPLTSCVLQIATKNLSLQAMDSTFNTVMDYSRFAWSLVYGENKDGDMLVSDDRMTYTYQDLTLHLPTLRAGLRLVLDELKSEMAKLRQNVDLDVSVPDNAVDDMSNTNYGYCWMDQGTYGNPDALMRVLLRDESLCFVTADNKLVWRPGPVMELLDKLAHINRLLQFLLHIVPGQPTRGTEAVDFRIRNGIRRRNIYRALLATWLITIRTKTEHISGRESYIPRKMPLEVAEPFHEYVLVYHAIAEFLASVLWGEEASKTYHEYLWVRNGQRVTGAQYSQTLGDISAKYIGVRLTVGPLRHFSVSLTREILKREALIDLDEEEDTFAAQRGHSRAVEVKHYAVEKGALSLLTSNDFRRFGNASIEWHGLLMMVSTPAPTIPVGDRDVLRSFSETVLGSTSREGVPRYDSQELEKVFVSAMSTVIQHCLADSEVRVKDYVARGLVEGFHKLGLLSSPPTSLTTSTGILGVNASTPASSSNLSGLLRDRISTPSSVSASSSIPSKAAVATPEVVSSTVASETLCNTSSIVDIPPGGLANEIPDPSLASHQSPQEASSQPPNADAVKDTDFAMVTSPVSECELLLWMMNGGRGDVAFRSEMQRSIVEDAVRGVESFLAIMPTGSGKSYAFFLPALKEDPGYTVVVLPQISLVHDLERRALTLPMLDDPHIWTAEDNDPGNASLVLTSLESVTSERFKHFLNQNAKRVKRIVFDEAHQIITEADFRHEFNNIKKLTEFPVQKIYLTATLPPRDLPSFCFATGHKRCLKMHRMSTDRPNIAYHVLEVPKGPRTPPVAQIILQLVKKLSTDMGKAERGIIFVRSRDVADWYANQVPCPRYHSGLDDTERRKEEEEWRWGKSRWIAATPGFAHGVDYHSVRYAIQDGLPFKVSDYVQGLGRLGRGLGVGDSVVVHDGLKRAAFEKPLFTHHLPELDNILGSRYCRRALITALMDGEPTSCDASKHRPCDNCHPQSNMSVLLRSLVTSGGDDRSTNSKAETGWKDGDTNNLKRKAEDDCSEQPAQRPFQRDVPRTVERNGSVIQTQASSSSGFRTGANSRSGSSSSSRFAEGGSISVNIDAAMYSISSRNKRDIADRLSTILDLLAGECIVCLIWYSAKVKKTDDHQFFTSCRQDSEPADNDMGWRHLKKKITLPKSHYCYSCGFPARTYRPDSHPDQVGAQHCPFKDYVVAFIWFACTRPGIWSEVQAAWSAPTTDNLQVLGEWLGTQTDDDHFCHSVELFVWMWDRYIAGPQGK